MKNRVAWPDVLKFIGMLAIYWGHMPLTANGIQLVFSFHVPLFFFASGFFEGTEVKDGFRQNLWKKVRSIVFPYFVFSLLSILICFLTKAVSINDIPKELVRMLLGERNNLLAVQLWFLPCLFLVNLIFDLLKRLLKHRVLIAAACIAIFIAGTFFIGHRPMLDPEWIWSLDSAMVYILYYMLGAFLFPILQRIKYQNLKAAGKIAWFSGFAAALAFALFLYLHGMDFLLGVKTAVGSNWFVLFSFLVCCIMLFCVYCLSVVLEKVRFFAYMGENSLYLCGNEVIIKSLSLLLITSLGWENIIYGNDFLMLLYCFVLLVICSFSFAPLERLLFGRLFGKGKRNAVHQKNSGK